MIDTNDKLFKAKLEVLRSILAREEQGRESKRIGLGWSDHSKDNQRKVEILDRIESDQSKKIRLDQ